MNKVAFLLSVCLVVALLSGCKKTEDVVAPEENIPSANNTTGGKLVNKVIDASVQDVTVSVPGKINVVIPKGMAPANTTITIEKIDAAGLPKDDKFGIMDVYEVKLSSGSSFSTPLRVTINYDASKAPTGKFRNKMGAAYLDETKKTWNVFADCVVDTINKTMTFPTKHLTKLSTWGFTSNTSVYTDYHSTTHFNIYWQAGKVYTNTEYKTPLPTAGSDPDYIKDIGRYLEDSYVAFKWKGLTVPTLVKVDVYLTSTLDVDDDGQTTNGYIYLNNKIKGEKAGKLTPEEAVPMACAHEFLHYVQDYYYVFATAKVTSMWWLEATATQADRMVWPNKTKFESFSYTDDLSDMIEKSWDDCNSDPAWYTAGCFLAYLSGYRVGLKANIAELIKKGGENTSTSYYRTVLDNYLTSSLNSQGIGIEYLNYIKWAFEQKDSIKIKQMQPTQSSTGNYKYVLPVFVPLKETTSNVKSTFPYLSVRSIKIYHDKNFDPLAEQEKEITITAKDIPADVYAYVYKMSNGKNSVTYYQGLKKDDKIILTLPKGGTNWIEILFVNTSKDNSKSIDIEVKSQVPDILKLLKNANSVNVSVQAKHNQGNTTILGNDYLGLSFTSADAKPYPPLNWASTSFSSSVVDPHKSGYSVEGSRSVTGTFSLDGKILTSIVSKNVINTYAASGILSKVETTEISLANLPYTGELPLSYIAGYGVSGANSSSYVTKIVYSIKTLNTTLPNPVWVTTKSYSSTTWNADSRVTVQFSNNN